MTMPLDVLGLALTIVAQTAVLASFLGRLAQEVKHLHAELTEVRHTTVSATQCNLLSSGFERRISALEAHRVSQAEKQQ